ncbi:hypothetical protein D3C80_127800 [compost metagenome]
MDMDRLKEDIRLAMDGLGGNDVAIAAACIAAESLDPAQEQEGGWGWVQAVLSECQEANVAALEVRKELAERNAQSRAPDQARFESWLVEYAPYLSFLWDFEASEMSQAMVESYIATAPHQQAIMCRFAAGVWLGNNEHQFDVISAAGVLNDKQRTGITAWFASPFWP